MPETRLEYLFNRYLQSVISRREEEELMELIALDENETEIRKLLQKHISDTVPEKHMPEQISASVLQNILGKKTVAWRTEKKKTGSLQMMVRVAAVLILFLSVAGYWYFRSQGVPGNNLVSGKNQTSSFLKGKAILTLSDGKTIVLDDAHNERFEHGDIRMLSKNKRLVFDTAGHVNAHAPVLYSTLTTPPGSRYSVVLPDGTIVWLNAGSSLYFPSRFTGPLREVEVTGEAYFEVAKNEKKPFEVRAGEVNIQVLGTQFNLSAYGDEESMQTSLLEGSIKIVRGKDSKLLLPGQKAILGHKKQQIEVGPANLEQVMAWKNGLFQFDGADIHDIMREISRWYGVEIVYDGNVPLRHFGGKISREASLSQVLKILELSNVAFSVEGKKIIVR